MASAELLRKSPYFASLDDETLARIAAPFSEVEFQPEQVLIQPGVPGAGLFVICEGSVHVKAHGFEDDLGPGEVVGELSLLEADGLRRARVVANESVRALALDRADFEAMLAAEPELADAMRNLARDRLAELSEFDDAG
ncbi:MAG TPA: cyclic nucleotide-binding domain-containing protein [Gaiellaceae bacterium]|nr:cyclic nucleotide-binding domain-containing protein [Gaiellaceae bacterium]